MSVMIFISCTISTACSVEGLWSKNSMLWILNHLSLIELRHLIGPKQPKVTCFSCNHFCSYFKLSNIPLPLIPFTKHLKYSYHKNSSMIINRDLIFQCTTLPAPLLKTKQSVPHVAHAATHTSFNFCTQSITLKNWHAIIF